MPTTPYGLPYPLPSESVRDGAEDIRALAEAIDSRNGGLLIQAGIAPFTSQPTGLFNYTFAKPFAATPTIVVGMTSWGAYTVRLAVGDYSGAYDPTPSVFHCMVYDGASNAPVVATSYFTFMAIGRAV